MKTLLVFVLLVIGTVWAQDARLDPALEAELLKVQLAAVQDQANRASSDFQWLVGAVGVVVVLVAASGIWGAVSARREVKEQIRQQLASEISHWSGYEKERILRALKREYAVDQTQVTYWCPEEGMRDEQAVELLKERGFKVNLASSQGHLLNPSPAVLIVDVLKLPSPVAKQSLEAVGNREAFHLEPWSVVVAYTQSGPGGAHVNPETYNKSEVLWGAANSLVSLVGRTVEAVEVHASLRGKGK